jgi:acyl-CoA synthetase (AMP-forming)/AMP-acid ligase II
MTVLQTADVRDLLWEEPRAQTLVELLTMPGRDYPNVAAMGLCHHQDTAETLTWGELLHDASVQAAALLARGVRPRDRVLLVLPTSRDYLRAFFGTMLAGAIPVPAAPPTALRGRGLELHLELLRSIAQSSASTACLTTARVAEVLRDALPLDVQTPAADGPELPESRIFAARPDDVAFLQYSSGSTSAPKGIEVTHGNVTANLAAIAELIAERDSVCVSWLPLHHDMGLIGSLLTGLYSRAMPVQMPPQAFVRNPARWLRAISDYRATITVAPNFAFRYCVQNVDVDALEGVRLDSLRVALNGAEPIDAGAVQAFQARFASLGLRPNIVRPVYGLAENSLAVTFADAGPFVAERIDAELLELTGEAIPARPGKRSRRFLSVGRPVRGVELEIADELDQPLPDRRVGQILVRGTSVMRGYFGDPDATAAALANGRLHTGDLGYVAGGQLFITGRAKDIIIRHGRNYYPNDIEHQLGAIADIGAVAVFVAGQANDEEVIVAAETRSVAAEELDKLDAQLRAAMYDGFAFGPAAVVLLHPGRIPRTTSGKVRRSECRRLYITGELPDRRSAWTPLKKT